MRTIVSLVCLFSLVLAGCASMPEAMRERFSPVPPKVRTFDGDVRTIFAAAKVALKQLDYTLTDSSGAPTRLEASSRILTSESLGDSRQTVANLHFHESSEGKTEVEVLISLQVESGSTGARSAQEKREHGFYDNFFATLEQVLQERAKETAGK